MRPPRLKPRKTSQDASKAAPQAITVNVDATQGDVFKTTDIERDGDGKITGAKVTGDG
jgi:hypothetical protein